MTISLRIVGFHNCYGCTKKVQKAFSKIDGVELVAFDPENGKAIVATAKQPEVVQYALEAKIKKKVIIVSQEVIMPLNQTFDLPGLGNLDSVDMTHSNMVRFNFGHLDRPPVFRRQSRSNNGFHMEDVAYEYASPRPLPQASPWGSSEPSAPPIPIAEDEVVYGYPPEHYGYSTTRVHDGDRPNECCTIM